MRIGFVERIITQSMDRNGTGRARAAWRLILGFALLSAIAGAAWLLVPLDQYVLARRGAEVPLDWIIGGLAAGFGLLGVLFFLGRNG